MAISPVVDITAYAKSLEVLIERWTLPVITDEMAALAQIILRHAIESPIPSDTRQLEESGQVEKDPQKGTVVFGFNRIYAAFQDSGHLPGATERVVTPNPPKKFLFIPLTQKGRRHTVGANPKDEGLVRGEDYILAKKAVIPIKAYGSALGPNRYFSRTFETHVDWFFEQLGASLEADLTFVGSKFKKRGGRGKV